ncbi:MAG: YraN family protein [Deltaproteobacteria bacterium]|nr:YraN family protein [Deltaproteobacteria bacterium]
MNRPSNPLGAAGEELAASHIQALGYRILDRNYRCPVGEIDCIAVRKGTLVFIEVKSRRSDDFGGPLEAVDRRKRRKMTRLAQYYALEKGLSRVPQRFDVVAVWFEGGRPRIEVYENAFDAEE